MNKTVSSTFKLGLVTLGLMSMTALAGEKIDKSLTTSADGFVVVDVQSGNVDIKTWDKNEVKVVGELDDDAEGYDFEVDGRKVYFKVDMPERRWGRYKNGKGSQLEFWLPAANQLKFEGVNVNVKADGVQGGSMINTVNGDIEASKLSDKIKLETVNGDISAEDLKGKISIHTVNGEVKDRNSEGTLAIETVNGEINSKTKATELALNNVNGDMRIVTGKVEDIEVSTVNGDLDIELELVSKGRFVYSSVGGDADILFSGKVSADFDIEAHAGGDIDNYITDDKVKEAKYGPSSRLRFKAGDGAADVEIDTVSGDIKLKKK